MATGKRQEEWPQRIPVGAFYESIIKDPIPYPWEKKPEEPPSSADPEVLPDERKPPKAKQVTADQPTKKKPGRKPKTATTSAPTTAEERARIVFGTRLAGPEDRAAHISTKKNQSTYIAGVLVPPQPTEPDNCCMSGCVNCVWELFREDMEEYKTKRAEAEQRLSQSAGSMDADGGGSESNWTPPQGVQLKDSKIAKDMWDDDIFKNVPVGIREFMKQEKKLKERHEREGH